MKQHQQIVVGVDFSPASRAALKVATRFAASNGAKVTAVHIMDPKSAGEYQQQHDLSDAELLDDLSQKLRAFVLKAEAMACRIALEVDVGNPFTTLISICERTCADMLVLGSRGTERGPKQLGALAAFCVREAPLDVLLAREERVGPFDRILACVDFSLGAEHTIEDARELAEGDRAELDFLFVHERSVTCKLPRETHLPLPQFQINTETVASSRNRLQEMVAPILDASANVPWHVTVSEGSSVRTGIFDHLTRCGADLVVLGSRAHQGHYAFTAGTTVEEIIRQGECSILRVA